MFSRYMYAVYVGTSDTASSAMRQWTHMRDVDNASNRPELGGVSIWKGVSQES